MGTLEKELFVEKKKMYIGEKSGFSLKGRQLEREILPMSWKPPNQGVEMGGACRPVWNKKEIQLIAST